MSMNQNKIKDIAESLLKTFFKAGKAAIDEKNKGFDIKIKSDKSPVTNGDLIVDEILRKDISLLTPDIPIISEETVNLSVENKNKTFWLVDPIDGTKEYINNKDEYTLNAALVINSRPSLGIIFAPEKNRMFFSYGPGFAYEFKNNKKITLNCKKKTPKGKILALSHSENPTQDILDILKKNNVSSFIKMSSSYKFCVIASGEFDIYTCRARAYEWDIAAGHAILIHAGGIVTTPEGKEIFYGKKDYKNPPLLIKRSKNINT